MHKPVHRSWRDLTTANPEAAAATVALDFAGTFTQGTYVGTPFAGRIIYDRATDGTEQHVSFALYENWQRPVVTMAVGGQVLAADGAAVYHRIFDGTANHYDFVTLYGTGSFDGHADAAFFELYFADEDGSTLQGTHLPSAEQLCAMPIKQLSFGTNAPDNVMSIGSLTLTPAA